jgi:hypothetical protein
VKTALIVVGISLILIGLAKLASSGGARLKLSNIGFNFGSTSRQTNTVGARSTENKTKSDWVGLAISIVGLATALVGWFMDNQQ